MKNEKMEHEKGIYSATVEQWLVAAETMKDEKKEVPYTFFIRGNSMYPFIRSGRDAVTVFRCNAEELRRGDIVLFRGQAYELDYVLHRIYRIRGERVQTLGDGNLRPDPWIEKGQICGRVEKIQRGGWTIMPRSLFWRWAALVWMQGYRHRKIPIKAFHRLGDWKNKWKKK